VKRRALTLVAALLGLVVMASAAHARVGGGQSFGGGSHSGHGGGGGDGELLGCIIELVVRCFIVAPVPTTIAVVVGLVIWFAVKSQAPSTLPAPRSVVARATPWITTLRQADPNFSLPVFLDFSVLLYMRVQFAAARRELALLRPYLAESVIQELPPPAGALEDVCVGSASITSAHVEGTVTRIVVRFEASRTETRADGRRAVCSHERWVFERRQGVLSRSPDDALTFACPSCGNPAEVKPDGRCTACGNVVADGRCDWSVARVGVEMRWTQRPDEVGSGGGWGTAPPTIAQPLLEREKGAFRARYPGFSFADFDGLVRRTFLALQDAWTKRAWEKARPYESDTIFQTHRFWIESYKRHARTNVLEQISVDRVELVKIERDAFFDAITVRIWFRMIDYTRDDATGQVLSGDPRTAHPATEYWTFIRRSGFDATSSSGDPGTTCPSCGAPVKVNMAGSCEHCGSKVTSGKFGWVVSRIDQDTAYAG